MSSLARFALLVLCALFLAAPAQAQGEGAPQDRKAPDAQRRKELLERYRSMSPAERKRLREVYEEKLRNASPEQRAKLKRRAKQLKQRNKKRKRFQGQSQERRERLRKAMKRLLQQLTPDERQALRKLPPEQRREKIQSLIKSNRQQFVARRLNDLPPDVRRQLEERLQGLEGKQRLRAARKAVMDYVRREGQRIQRDESLTPEQRREKIKALRDRYLPKRWRQEMARRAGKGKGPKAGRRAGKGTTGEDKPGSKTGSKTGKAAEGERARRLKERRQRELRERRQREMRERRQRRQRRNQP